MAFSGLGAHSAIHVCDTTLRDGEQMPGVSFSVEQKVELAERIDAFGAHSIELMPAVGRQEQDVVGRLADLSLLGKVTASTMLRFEHVELAAKLGLLGVTLFAPVSDLHLERKLRVSRAENLARSLAAIDHARSLGLSVRFAAEDASRADPEYLSEFCREVSPHLEFLVLCDTVGCLTPARAGQLFARARQDASCPLGAHFHDDFGLATANTLAALEGGASMVSGTFCGIGERAGNAALEELVCALKFLYGVDLGLRLEQLNGLCAAVSRHSGVAIPANKPVVGANAFAHESGIHVDGVLKDPRTYEFVDPASVGATRRLFFGRKSGRRSVEYLLGRCRRSGVEAGEFFERLKQGFCGRSFSEEEFVSAAALEGLSHV